jgi:hypothetical protein
VFRGETADGLKVGEWVREREQLGKRTTADAQQFVHDLVMRFTDGCVPLFTTDGLRQYFWALTAHFGFWQQQPGHRKPTWIVNPDLLHGQLKKFRVYHKLKCVVTVGCAAPANSRSNWSCPRSPVATLYNWASFLLHISGILTVITERCSACSPLGFILEQYAVS